MSEFVGRIDQLDSIELDAELRNGIIKQLREVILLYLTQIFIPFQSWNSLGGEVSTPVDPNKGSSGTRSISGIVLVFFDILRKKINHRPEITRLESFGKLADVY